MKTKNKIKSSYQITNSDIVYNIYLEVNGKNIEVIYHEEYDLETDTYNYDMSFKSKDNLLTFEEEQEVRKYVTSGKFMVSKNG